MSIEANGASPTSPSRGIPFAVALLIVVGCTVAFTMLLQQSIRPAASIKTPAPELVVAGWFDGAGPTPEDLHGKVIVLDAWAFWCGPCRARAPELVDLYNQYRDRGVVFIGLTGEGAEALSQGREFLEATRITWPNAYGAGQTLQKLKNEYIPQKWVIDRHYNLIWNDSPFSEPIEAAIDRALAEAP